MVNAESNKNNNIWHRRVSNRLTGAPATEAPPEDVTCSVPPTPPDDNAVSKRRWGRNAQAFHRSLRNQAQQSPIEWLGGFSTEELPAQGFLSGNWQDQRGSIYTLSPGKENSFHVETTRPCGQRRYTRDLVRVTMVRGREKTIWGRCRYELERRGPKELLWRGKSVNDIFSWCRI